MSLIEHANEHLTEDNKNLAEAFSDMGPKDQSVLLYIYEYGDKIKPGDIAKKLTLPHSTINSVIKRLVVKQYVEWKEYYFVELLPIARKIAAHHLNHHIIIHHYFEKQLGLGFDEAHLEGLRAAGVLSCRTVLKMFETNENCDLKPCHVFVPNTGGKAF